MTSKNWLSESVLACGITSLLICCAIAQTAPQTTPPVPAIALVDPSDAADWNAWVGTAGWRVIVPATGANPDARVQALAVAVDEAVKSGAVDPGRVYLAGRGPASAAVFYTISRIPDRWAAGIAIDGSPQPAIDTGRVFAANFTNVPVLWASKDPAGQQQAAAWKQDGLNIEWRSSQGFTAGAALEWLSKHQRAPFPNEIDCETNSPAYARCYWIEITKFDPMERNDVLPSTKMTASARVSLDLGAFSYEPSDVGPGIQVTTLPEKYSGPLKVNDRIVAIDGRPLANVQAYLDVMSKYTEEKPVVVTVQRGKDRVRVETRVVVSQRDPGVTARVEAQYLPADREIQIVSRIIKEMKVTVPPEWAQDSKLFWNGLALEKIDGPGCFVLSVEKELLNAARCK